MTKVLDALKEWGCDVDGALERFIGDMGLYEVCLKTVLSDKSFDGLGESLKSGEVKVAFDHAHTLKGVLANMGLTPMYDITVRIVEPLRGCNDENLFPIYEELLQAREKLAGILGQA